MLHVHAYAYRHVISVIQVSHWSCHSCSVSSKNNDQGKSLYAHYVSFPRGRTLYQYRRLLSEDPVSVVMCLIGGQALSTEVRVIDDDVNDMNMLYNESLERPGREQ